MSEGRDGSIKSLSAAIRDADRVLILTDAVLAEFSGLVLPAPLMTPLVIAAPNPFFLKRWNITLCVKNAPCRDFKQNVHSYQP
jgi:hypothetical protein